MHGYIDAQLNTMIEDIGVVGKAGNLQLDAVLDTALTTSLACRRNIFLTAI